MSGIGSNDDLVQNQNLWVDETLFKIMEPLGRGGNSCVYLVRCVKGPLQGLLFAAKVFTNVDNMARLDRFKIELKFLKQPQHPAIMLVYGSGTFPHSSHSGTLNLPFYIAEYLPKTLRDAIRSGMSMVEKVAVAMQLVAALAFLEKNDPQIIHRDIKPENIFIKGRSAVLGDFGLLKAIGDQDSTNQFSVKDLSRGIRHPRFYPTPELVEYAKGIRQSISPKSDVFQLGLVFCDMFCGESPLKERDIYDSVELDSVGFIPGDNGPAIRSNIERMLIFDPDLRPSAAELFDQWDGIFQGVVDGARRLEGRSFW